MIGWLLSFSSAFGNAANDVVKKTLLNKGFEAWEGVALTNLFGCYVTLTTSLLFGELPQKFELWFIISSFFTAVGKAIAQYCYFKALEGAPLSLVIPYLAWNPVFLLIVGTLFLGEKPQILGIFGCLLVLAGAYFIGIDSNIKNKKKNYSDKKDDSQLQFSKQMKQNNGNFMIQFIRSILNFKPGLYMMGVSICWTYTSAMEKWVLKSEEIPETYFLGIQRFFMSLPFLLISIQKRPKFITNVYSSFFALVFGAIIESATVVLYFLSLKWVYVSYVIAIKRAGNILISTLVGKYWYKEELTLYTIISNICMIFGVLAIVLS